MNYKKTAVTFFLLAAQVSTADDTSCVTDSDCPSAPYYNEWCLNSVCQCDHVFSTLCDNTEVCVGDWTDGFECIVPPPNQELGSKCRDHSQCASSQCTLYYGPDVPPGASIGACTCNLATNDGCDGDTICYNPIHISPSLPTCGLPLGSSCSYDIDCVSENCEDGTCRCNNQESIFLGTLFTGCPDETDICFEDTDGNICIPEGSPGSVCETNEDCLDGGFFSGLCQEGICQCDEFYSTNCPGTSLCVYDPSNGGHHCVDPGTSLSIYDECRGDSQCASGYCFFEDDPVHSDRPDGASGRCACDYYGDGSGCEAGQICYAFIDWESHWLGPECSSPFAGNTCSPGGFLECGANFDCSSDGVCQCNPDQEGHRSGCPDSTVCVGDETGGYSCVDAPVSSCSSNDDCPSAPYHDGLCLNGICQCDYIFSTLCEETEVCVGNQNDGYECVVPPPNQELGSKCRNDSQCASGQCTLYTVPDDLQGVSVSVGTCTCNQETNYGCEDETTCYFPIHIHPAQPTCGLPLGSSCSYDLDCVSENCLDSVCQCNNQESVFSGTSVSGCQDESDACVEISNGFACVPAGSPGTDCITDEDCLANPFGVSVCFQGTCQCDHFFSTLCDDTEVCVGDSQSGYECVVPPESQPIGSKCRNDSQCETGQCDFYDGTNVPPGVEVGLCSCNEDTNAGCEGDTTCYNVIHYSTRPPMCGNPLGAECSHDLDCVNENCWEGTCQCNNRLSPFTGTTVSGCDDVAEVCAGDETVGYSCLPAGQPGSTCVYHTDCYNGDCCDSVCVSHPGYGEPCSPPGSPGWPCESNGDCLPAPGFEDGRCLDGRCQCDTYVSALCPEDEVCVSSEAGGYDCVVPPDSQPLWSKCRTDSQCASDYCGPIPGPPLPGDYPFIGYCFCNPQTNAGCDDTLTCYIPSTTTDSAPICGPSLGEACVADYGCASENCVQGTCQCNPDGVFSNGCPNASEVCVGNDSEGYRCELPPPPGSPGSPCESNDDCEDGDFAEGLCVDGLCQCDIFFSTNCPEDQVCKQNDATGSLECVPPGSDLSLGETCRQNNDCFSGFCFFGLAAPGHHGHCACNVNSETSGCPSSSQECYLPQTVYDVGPQCGKRRGRSCSDDLECVTENCYEGICHCQPLLSFESGGCEEHQECLESSTEGFVCSPSGPPGSTCTISSDCIDYPEAPGNCWNGICRCDDMWSTNCPNDQVCIQENGSGPFLCVEPQEPLSTFQNCRTDSHCASGNCFFGLIPFGAAGRCACGPGGSTGCEEGEVCYIPNEQSGVPDVGPICGQLSEDCDDEETGCDVCNCPPGGDCICGELVEGAVELGLACLVDSQCETGSCFMAESDTLGVCSCNTVDDMGCDEGEFCDGDSFSVPTCVEELSTPAQPSCTAIGDPCTEMFECCDFAICRGGTCRPRLQNNGGGRKKRRRRCRSGRGGSAGCRTLSLRGTAA